jgi:serine protease Do
LRAGIKPGDVIVEFNGRPVKDSDALVSMVVATKPGQTVPMTIVRDKKRQSINVTVGELNLDEEQGRQTRQAPDSEPTSTGFGMDIEAITPDIARELGVPRNQGGAIVSYVNRSGPAAAGRVIPNDVILEVNRVPVTSVAQVTRELERVPSGGTVFLLVWRITPAGGQQVFLTLRKR